MERRGGQASILLFKGGSWRHFFDFVKTRIVWILNCKSERIPRSLLQGSSIVGLNVFIFLLVSFLLLFVGIIHQLNRF